MSRPAAPTSPPSADLLTAAAGAGVEANPALIAAEPAPLCLVLRMPEGVNLDDEQADHARAQVRAAIGEHCPPVLVLNGGVGLEAVRLEEARPVQAQTKDGLEHFLSQYELTDGEVDRIAARLLERGAIVVPPLTTEQKTRLKGLCEQTYTGVGEIAMALPGAKLTLEDHAALEAACVADAASGARRVKILRMSSFLLVGLLEQLAAPPGERRCVVEGLPQGCRFAGVSYDIVKDEVLVRLEHPSFPLVREGFAALTMTLTVRELPPAEPMIEATGTARLSLPGERLQPCSSEEAEDFFASRVLRYQGGPLDGQAAAIRPAAKITRPDWGHCYYTLEGGAYQWQVPPVEIEPLVASPADHDFVAACKSMGELAALIRQSQMEAVSKALAAMTEREILGGASLGDAAEPEPEDAWAACPQGHHLKDGPCMSSFCFCRCARCVEQCRQSPY